LRLQRKLSVSNFKLIYFEDLIRNTEDTLKELCKTAQIPFSKEMLKIGFQDSSLKSEIKMSDKDNIGMDVDTLRRWKNRLSPSDEGVIRGLASNTLRKLNYKSETANPSFKERLAFQSELSIQKFGLSLMKAGFYPDGAI